MTARTLALALSLALLPAAHPQSSSQDIAWQRDADAAFALAQRTGRPLAVYFHDY